MHKPNTNHPHGHTAIDSRRTGIAVGAVLAAILAGCGGGGGSSGQSGGTSLFDGYGPGNPSSCPHAAADDIWFNKRLSCLAAGQKFIESAGASGATADRAFMFGQQVLNANLNNVLGSGKLRYFQYALCVKNAPANISTTGLADDLGVAMGLNTLATGTTFYPPGVSGSTFAYGGIAGPNSVNTPCDPAAHPVIVDYATGRIVSVNAAALAQLQVLDR